MSARRRIAVEMAGAATAWLTSLDAAQAATARALSVHPNTVLLRLRRASRLLAVDLDDVDHLTAVRAALLLHELAQPR